MIKTSGLKPEERTAWGLALDAYVVYTRPDLVFDAPAGTGSPVKSGIVPCNVFPADYADASRALGFAGQSAAMGVEYNGIAAAGWERRDASAYRST